MESLNHLSLKFENKNESKNKTNKNPITYFCKSEFLNFSAFSSIRNCSALFLEADSNTECFTSAIAEGLLSGSG